MTSKYDIREAAKKLDIVSLANNVSFWAQKPTYSSSFWAEFNKISLIFPMARILEKKQLWPETDKMYKFLAPENDPYLTHFNNLGGQKLIKGVSFWPQKS